MPGVIGIKEQIYKTPPMTDAVSIAHCWMEKGFGVAPCRYDTKLLSKGFGPHKKTLVDSADINLWFRNRRSNLAVIAPDLGVILDFDNVDLFSQFRDATPEAAQAYTERTPRGGAHVFLKILEPVSFRPVKGLEIKKLVLAYPSVVEGRAYRVEGGDLITVDLRKILDGFGFFGVKDTESHDSASLRPSHGQIELHRGVIAKIKHDWPIRDYLAFFEPNLKLWGEGRWLAGLCPFHEDHHPSLWIDVERDLWGCHACSAHGDIINWHSERKGISVRDAIQDLLKWSESIKVRLD